MCNGQTSIVEKAVGSISPDSWDGLEEIQIEKYNLQWCGGSDLGNDEYEDFHGKSVADLQRLKEQICNQFLEKPNPIKEKQINVRVPQFSIDKDKEAYTNAMYASELNDNKCFCQMCQRTVLKKYIERNDVQKLPCYGWIQTYLSLCLTCSKDYIALRDDDFVWKKFIHNILATDVKGKEKIAIPIGNKELTFTAVHLAEVQAILGLENKEG